MPNTLDPNRIKQDILRDMQVELSDEFDKNFERKAFFTERCAARRYQNPKGSLLMVTGTMRRSIQGHVEGDGVRHFVLYEVEIDGIAYELKCKAVKKKMNNMEERPYSLKKKDIQ